MKVRSALPNDVKGMALGGVAGVFLGMAIGSALSWLVGGTSTFSRMFFIFHVCFAMSLTGIWTGPLFASAEKASQEKSGPAS